MTDWQFRPVPTRGHYEHVDYGPYLCVVDPDGGFSISLWRKTANDNHVCHVWHNGHVPDHPAREPKEELDDGDDPRMELVPVSVEEFHRLKFIARHLHSKDAWTRFAQRVAERNRQVT